MPSIGRLVFVALFAISSATLCSCGNRRNAVGAVAGMGGQAASPSGAIQTAGAGGTGVGGAGTTGGAAATPKAGAGGTSPSAGAGGVGAQAGTGAAGGAGSAAGATSTPAMDCTAPDWKNPGMVMNPEVVAVPADAGMGVPYDQVPTKEEMDEYHYVMEEFFFTGTSPAYTSRMVVRRPQDPAKFSGTVFAEWYNVSGGIDFAVMWANSREYLMREGHVFVGISAQQVGADALKTYDATRYAMIQHPGDTAAAAIFSQAGVALHLQSAKLLGPCMPVHAVLALGQSQSAAQLTQYVNSTHPTDKVYDGFLLHSGGEPATNNPGSPTFVVFTMTEGNGSLSDGPNMVEWMVAGATHNDARVTMRGADGLPAGSTAQPKIQCLNPLNEFPSYRVYNTVLDWLHRWVRNGEKPPAGMPFQAPGGQLALDEHMNGLGGVRLPDIDVPIATYAFDNGPKDPTDIIGYLACGLGGQTIPFTAAELLKLYPTHDDYVQKYTAAADKALAGGYLLKADCDESVQQANAAPIPK
jgi:hypothetical protein